jgi:hypothetical protein
MTERNGSIQNASLKVFYGVERYLPIPSLSRLACAHVCVCVCVCVCARVRVRVLVYEVKNIIQTHLFIDKFLN